MDENVQKKLTDPKRIILILLLFFVLRGLIYASVVPLWNAPDEPAHYQSAQILTKKISPDFKVDKFYGKPDRAVYGKNPTGYYWMATLVGLIPGASRTLMERAYILRFISIILSAGVVYFTFRMAREVFPEDQYIYLGAPMLVALFPMYTFTGMSINADNLAIFIFALFLWMAVRTLARGVELPSIILMVLAIVAGVLTKRTTFVSIVIFVVIPFFYIFRARAMNGSQRWFRIVTVGLAALVFSLVLPILTDMGNVMARLDIKSFFLAGSQVLPAVVGRGQLNTPTDMFITTFWGKFGWADVPLPQNLYNTLQKIWLLPAAGYVYLIGSFVVTRKAILARTQWVIIIFLVTVASMVIVIILVYQPVIGAGWPQGRYAWTVLGALALLFCAAVFKAVGRKYEGVAFIALAIGTFLFDLRVLAYTLIPRYISSISLSKVVWHDPIQTIHPSLAAGLQNRFALTNAEIKTILSWRPAIFETGIFYYLLFLLYFIVFSIFLAQVIRYRKWEMIAEEEPLSLS